MQTFTNINTDDRSSDNDSQCIDAAIQINEFENLLPAGLDERTLKLVFACMHGQSEKQKAYVLVNTIYAAMTGNAALSNAEEREWQQVLTRARNMTAKLYERKPKQIEAVPG